MNNLNIDLERQSVCSLLYIWPLTASVTSEVKNDYAHVKTLRILDKFTEMLDVWFGRDDGRAGLL